MNFKKHKVSEREMLSEMMDYCHRIIKHRAKSNKKYLDIIVCISSNTGGVEVRHRKWKGNSQHEKLLLSIRYDERNDFYYFLERVGIGKNHLERRVVINNKSEFYAYFDQVVESVLLQ